ncbi:MAG TPA: aryl-sulfate sulfotransferase [Chitinophagales bacterium]|nr:aryl-sulfate sulfotransferase [Chitinophagales bacterium]
MKKILFFTTTLLSLLVISFHSANAQFEYSYPMNGSENEFPNTTIILRNGQLMDPNSLSPDLVTLTGSKSGVIPATIVLSTNGKTVCITPAVPFAWEETVSVNVKDGLRTLAGQILSGTSMTFSIRREMTPEEKQRLQEYLSTHDDDGNLINDPDQQSVYVPPPASERGTALPYILIYTNNNPAPGKIFFNRNSGVLPASSAELGYGIIESNGDSVFYRTSLSDGANFHMNLNGLLTAYHLDFGVDTDVIELNANYDIIDHVHCKNGLTASQHEHIFFPDGTKWFTCYDWQVRDLTQYGGSATAFVNVSWIEELDANGLDIFHWRSDQYFNITDACTDILLTSSEVDPWHINAMSIDNDGKIIASFRNMNRIVKINTNGSIAWQWGGMSGTPCPNNISDFVTLGDGDGGFSHQHNVHRIENGNILMLDNGNSQPQNTWQSRPKEYILDETNLTATLHWSYTHPQVSNNNMFTKNQGSAQRLPNGNTIIGYGLPSKQGLPNGTEIDASGNIIWEFRFKDSTEYSYRIYKGDNNVGIADVDFSNHLNVFPNPSDGIINLKMDVPMDKINISLLNLLGQTVYSKSENSGAQNISLDLSKLNKGFYFLEVTSGMKKMVGSILLQ